MHLHPGHDQDAVQLIAVIVAWLAGDMARAIREYRQQLQLVQRRRAVEELQLARAEERLRLSREVHDVVSHSLGAIAVQAGVARLVFAQQPDQAVARAVGHRDGQPAITIVAAGESLLAPAITRRLIAEFARRPRTAAPSAGDVLAPLTERELQVLQQVAAGSSNAEVAAALHLSVATVKTHISRLLSKLDCGDRAQLVVVAYETGVAIPGLRLSPPGRN